MNESTDENAHGEESKDHTVILFLSYSILSACLCKIIFSKILRNKIPLPFTVSILLIGFIIGIIVNQTKSNDNDFSFGEIQLSGINPHLMYYIFLPLLIFDSSFNGHFHIIRQQLLSAILMAGPGVLISTVIIAICGIYIFPYRWSWLYGLMFGSILSATDPVAVVALLHDSGASRSLASLIDSESLLNDGSAFVLFLIFRNIIVGEGAGAKDIIVNIVKYSIGGPAFGLACGFLSVILLNRINNELEVEITFTFGLAYLVFYLADVELGISAVLALVAMGLYMSKYKYCISSNVQPSMANAWRITTYFVNILIFTITGLILARSFIGTATSISSRDFGFSIVLYIVIHVGRVCTVSIMYPLMHWTGVHLSWKDCVILTWSGLRGSMSLILVLIVSLDQKIDPVTRDRFLFHISMIVLLTLTVNGTSSKFLVKLLGLHRGTEESEIVLLQALEYMRRQTSWKLSQMKDDDKFADVDWEMLIDYLPDKLLEELDVANDSNLHQRLSQPLDDALPRDNLSSQHELQVIPTIYQTDSMPSSPVNRRKRSIGHDDVRLSVVNLRQASEQNQQNLRDELIVRFLTAMSIDYEKQWYLGMIRRQTLDILIKSVEQAKRKCSFESHWKSILEHFHLPIHLRLLLNFKTVAWIDRWAQRLFFDHIFRTIELTLSFHSAKSRIDNIRHQFPELSNINERLMNDVCEEVKMHQTNAMHILFDLQQSYRLCWIIQMTRRCAQMLLKYESIAIIQLFETGMLEENEYTHILELIEDKLFTLEYGRIQMPKNQVKRFEDPIDLMTDLQSLSPTEKIQWKTLLMPKHQWFQPSSILLNRHEPMTAAYWIIRGIVQYKDEAMPTYYKCGNIIGIDALFFDLSSSHGTFSATGGLVEVFRIDRTLLNLLLTDEKLSRSIYNEIALHTIMHHYRKSFHLTHSQLKQLLVDRAVMYRNEQQLSLHLCPRQRLFLLSGTLICSLDGRENILESHHFQVVEVPFSCQLNSGSVVYKWTEEDEIYCVNMKKFKVDFSLNQSQLNMAEPFYPLYLGDSIEFTPRRRASSSITRPTDMASHFRFIPSDIEVNNDQLTVPTPAEFVPI